MKLWYFLKKKLNYVFIRIRVSSDGGMDIKINLNYFHSYKSKIHK